MINKLQNMIHNRYNIGGLDIIFTEISGEVK